METQKLGRNFWNYRIGQLISLIGDSCGHIALAWWVLEETNSPAQMASILTPVLAVRLCLMPLFGPLADRLSRKALLITSDVLRALTCLALVLLAIQPQFHFAAVLAVCVVSSAASALFTAASSGFIQEFVEPSQLSDAIRRVQSLNASGGIVGGIVAGILVSAIGYRWTLALDGFSFLCAAFMTATINRNRDSLKSSIASKASYLNELRSGFSFVIQHRVILWTVVCLAAMNFVLAPLALILPVFAKQAVDSPWFLGAIETAMAIGVILSTQLISLVRKKMSSDSILVLGLLLMAFSIAGLGFVQVPYGALVAMLFAGVGSGFASITLSTQFSLSIPSNMRSRLGSILGFVTLGIAPIGMALSGLAIETLGLANTLTLSGGVLFLLAPLLLAVPNFSKFMRASPEEATRNLLL